MHRRPQVCGVDYGGVGETTSGTDCTGAGGSKEIALMFARTVSPLNPHHTAIPAQARLPPGEPAGQGRAGRASPGLSARDGQKGAPLSPRKQS